MRVEIMPDENQEAPIDEHGKLCTPDDVALGIVVHSRTGSPYDAGHVDACGDTRIIARSSQDWRIGVDITPIRIRSKNLRSEGEYPREVGIKIIPGQDKGSGNKLQIRKLMKDDEELLGAFILSGTFMLWGDDKKGYIELLPGLWRTSELVFEIDL